MKSFEIGYGEDKVIIHPKMASIEMTDNFSRDLADVSDTGEAKYDTEFSIYKTAIDSFSAKPAEKVVKDKGITKRVPLEGGIASHFSARTPEAERIVREAYQIVVSQMRPSSSFLDSSVS